MGGCSSLLSGQEASDSPRPAPKPSAQPIAAKNSVAPRAEAPGRPRSGTQEFIVEELAVKGTASGVRRGSTAALFSARDGSCAAPGCAFSPGGTALLCLSGRSDDGGAGRAPAPQFFFGFGSTRFGEANFLILMGIAGAGVLP